MRAQKDSGRNAVGGEEGSQVDDVWDHLLAPYAIYKKERPNAWDRGRGSNPGGYLERTTLR